MPPMLWQAKTQKDILVGRYGMGAEHNPVIHCACGRKVHADVCVDITLLPVGVRKALGLQLVDYLCDGCQTRLFRELHITEEEFYQLLGAPEEALVFHRERDPDHVRGCDLRTDAQKPRHAIVSRAQMVGLKLGQIEVSAPIPLARRRRSHHDAARTVHTDPDNGIALLGFPVIEAFPVKPDADPTLPVDGGVVAQDPGTVDPSIPSVDTPPPTSSIDDLPADLPADLTTLEEI